MAIAVSVAQCLEQAANADIHPVDSSRRLWHLDDPSLLSVDRRARLQHLLQVKQRILGLLAQTNAAVIIHADSPIEEELPGVWVPLQDPRAWLLPHDIDLTDRAIATWLFALGHWTVSSDALAGSPMPDFFRASSSDILSWVDEQRLAVVIESFPDDVHWVVALGNVRNAA